MGMIPEWKIQIYERHIGIVDGDGASVASIVGKRGDKRAWRNAELIVAAVNHAIKGGAYENREISPR